MEEVGAGAKAGTVLRRGEEARCGSGVWRLSRTGSAETPSPAS